MIDFSRVVSINVRRENPKLVVRSYSGRPERFVRGVPLASITVVRTGDDGREIELTAEVDQRLVSPIVSVVNLLQGDPVEYIRSEKFEDELCSARASAKKAENDLKSSIAETAALLDSLNRMKADSRGALPKKVRVAMAERRRQASAERRRLKEAEGD